MKRSTSYLLDEAAILRRERTRLVDQARTLFAVERPIVSRIIGRTGKSILDAGCGNGAYLALLGRELPGCSFAGVDRHPGLLGDARRRCARSTALAPCDLTDRDAVADVVARHRPDVVILRFVLQHMSPDERDAAIENLHRTLRRGAKLLVIEPDPEGITTTPASPAIAYLASRVTAIMSARGADRQVGRLLPQALGAFVDVARHVRDAGSRALGWPATRRIYLPILGTRIGEAAPLDHEALQLAEARRWFRRASVTRGHRLTSNLLFTSCERG